MDLVDVQGVGQVASLMAGPARAAGYPHCDPAVDPGVVTAEAPAGVVELAEGLPVLAEVAGHAPAPLDLVPYPRVEGKPGAKAARYQGGGVGAAGVRKIPALLVSTS